VHSAGLTPFVYFSTRLMASAASMIPNAHTSLFFHEIRLPPLGLLLFRLGSSFCRRFVFLHFVVPRTKLSHRECAGPLPCFPVFRSICGGTFLFLTLAYSFSPSLFTRTTHTFTADGGTCQRMPLFCASIRRSALSCFFYSRPDLLLTDFLSNSS